MQVHSTFEKLESEEKNIAQFSRKNYLNQMDYLKPRRGKQYIYVLFTNSQRNKTTQVPYYVGSAHNLISELPNSELEWHYGVFRQKAVIHVIACVPEENSETAVDETATMLRTKGYLIDSYLGGLDGFKSLLWHEITEYMKNSKNLDSPFLSFESLRNKWKDEETHSRSLLANSTQIVTSAELHRRISQRNYGNHASKSLSRTLSKLYDPATQSATHTFFLDASDAEEKKRVEIKSILKGLKGDWYIADGGILLFNTPIIFRPVDSLIRPKPQIPSSK